MFIVLFVCFVLLVICSIVAYVWYADQESKKKDATRKKVQNDKKSPNPSPNPRPAPSPLINSPPSSTPPATSQQPSAQTLADFIESMKSGTIIGSGFSKDTIALGHLKEPVEATEASLRKMLENGLRTTNTPTTKNHFHAENKALADAVIPMCLGMKSDDEKFKQCAKKLLVASPVWLMDAEETQDRDKRVLDAIRSKVRSCAQDASYACLDDLSKYARDLDNFGLPRVHDPNFLKMVEFYQGIREEASKYVGANAEEEAMRRSVVSDHMKNFGMTPELQFMSAYKTKVLPCGCGGYSNDWIMGLTSFTDFYAGKYPSKLYTFIHELAHMISHGAVYLLNEQGYYKWRGYGMNCTACPDGKTSVCGQQWIKPCTQAYASHDEFWHKCCIFLSNMIKRHFMAKGIVKSDAEYRTYVSTSGFEYYHGCHIGLGSTIENPGTWTMNEQNARTGGNDMFKVKPSRPCPS